MTKDEEFQRMKAALQNILELSADEFSKSQARYGLGIAGTAGHKLVEANQEGRA
ncbi:hypothetical protein [Paenibacillus mesophilus]|uniref:hypothetical protein n=1 Tax=Paenibacillus mesophilus TaxID=2582849 RepID=UPI0013051C76|nr:hypothetical protein [Paenibacillus mesophilus]